jgi:hypothetical protein
MAGKPGNPQPMKALERANAVREARRDAHGTVDPHPMLAGDDADWEDTVRNVPLRQLLEMIPGVGPVTRAEAIDAVGLEETTRLMMVTWDKRKELADLMREALSE